MSPMITSLLSFPFASLIRAFGLLANSQSHHSMTAGFYFPLAIRSLMAEIPIIILRTNPVINIINRPADFLPEASFIRSNMEFLRLLLSFQIKWIIISDQYIKHEINQVQAQNSLYNPLYLGAAMNDFKPALLRKTAKWRLT